MKTLFLWVLKSACRNKAQRQNIRTAKWLVAPIPKPRHTVNIIISWIVTLGCFSNYKPRPDCTGTTHTCVAVDNRCINSLYSLGVCWVSKAISNFQEGSPRIVVWPSIASYPRVGVFGRYKYSLATLNIELRAVAFK